MTTLKVLPPDPFGGNVLDVKDWWFKARNYIVGNHVKEEEAVPHLISLLKDHAATWIQSLEQLPADLTAFGQALFTRFPPPPEQVLRDRWASVKMDGNLEQYISAQVTAAARIPMVTEGEKIHHFICGLEDEIQTDVRRAQPKTLNEAIAAAYAADTLSRKRKMEANWASIPRKKSKLVTRQKPLKWSAAEFQKIRENKACFECGKQGQRQQVYQKQNNYQAEKEYYALKKQYKGEQQKKISE